MHRNVLTRIAFIYCFLTVSLCRPPNSNERNENDEKETEYEADGESAVDDDDSRLDREEAMDEQEDESRSQMTNFNDRPSKTNTDNFSEYKLNKNTEDKYEDSINSNGDYESHSQRRQSNTYTENNDANDQAETSQHFINRDVNNYKLNSLRDAIHQNEFNKKGNPLRAMSSDEGEPLFDNKKIREKLRSVDKREYSNEAIDPREQSRYFKEFYNTMQGDKRAQQDERNYENVHFILNRDRRQTFDSIQKDKYSHVGDKQNFGDTVNDDEESAIKRHLKKLSGEELEELLNSLSDDKRALLNKIMENDHNNYHINKREITKKAGASEENGCIEAGISDSRKVQGDSVIARDTDTTENTKQPESQSEIAEISSTKNADHSDSGDNKAESTNISEIGNMEKTEVSLNDGNNANIKNQASIGSNLQMTPKNDNKREANENDALNVEVDSDDAKLSDNEFSAKDSQKAFNDGYFCNQDEELSQLMEDEADLHNSDSNLNKREAFLDSQIDLNELKSLEDSFPNSNAYEESGQYSESDMVPLIRVKRKNEDLSVQKRAAALMPDAKVAYFPYRAENEDEDNEEGNEFDDDGFYDRTSNIAHINGDSNPSEITAEDKSHLQAKYSKTDFVRNENVEGDTMSIGSDTDSVLSGVEGVDDNLMFSSGSRNRRATEDKPLAMKVMKLNRPLRSTPFIEDEMKSASENYINAPNYQESDAFGALPKNYETDLSRFKRIRRVKPSPSDVSPLSA